MLGSPASPTPPHHHRQHRYFHRHHHHHPILTSSTAYHLITTSASLRVGHHCFHSILHNLPPFASRLKDAWFGRELYLRGFELLKPSKDAIVSASLSFFQFSDGGGGGHKDASQSDMPARKPRSGRHLTNIILALNILIYIGQLATRGKLLFWGAKINSLIDKGQLWRLVTSSLLHANVAHLMVNCYSLNSVGPTVESITGPRRYMAVYFTSAIASSIMSYYLSKAPAVGASGAIFGLVGSVAVFVLRHRGLIGGANEELKHIANVIVLNMVIGLLSKDIDNWGHLGGLLGGAATSWFVGPAWKFDSMSDDGRRILVDRVPISFIRKRNGPSGKLS